MNRSDYAVVIGIDDYPRMPDRYTLEQAQRGARDFYDWLVDPAGGAVPADNVARLLLSELASPDLDHPYPTKRDLDDELARFYPGGTGRVGRRFYFYFGGHGLGPSFDEAALLMADAARLRLSNVGIKLYTEHLYQAAPFDELVIFLDCCRELFERVHPAPPLYTQMVDQERAGQVRLYQAFATRFTKKAFESPTPSDGEGGLFTAALLQGLRGEAAEQGGGRKGQVTGASLKDYLERRVRELAKAAEREQEPDIRPLHADDMVFCTVDAVPRQVVRIHVPAGWEGELVLRDGSWREIARESATGIWEIALPRGLYRIDHLVEDEQVPQHKKLIDVDFREEAIDVSFE